MNRKIRVLIIGADGVIGRWLVKNLTERGCEIVAAVDVRDVGEDVGELAGIGSIGLPIVENIDLGAIIDSSKPDVAIDCSLPDFREIYDHLMICADHGLDVLTTSDRTYYPWCINQDMCVALDNKCKENGSSICAFGVQDVNWSGLCTVLAAGCADIKKIIGVNMCMLDAWGASGAEICGANLTPAQFEERYCAGNVESERGSYTYALYSIADELGLHVIKETNKVMPVYSKNGYYCEACGVTIEKGNTLGTAPTCILETEEGITLQGTINYVYAENGYTSENTWRIEGDPDMYLIQEDMHGEITTQIDLMNRIPDVMNAKPGLLTVKDLPKASYRVNKNLAFYVNKD